MELEPEFWDGLDQQQNKRARTPGGPKATKPKTTRSNSRVADEEGTSSQPIDLWSSDDDGASAAAAGLSGIQPAGHRRLLCCRHLLGTLGLDGPISADPGTSVSAALCAAAAAEAAAAPTPRELGMIERCAAPQTSPGSAHCDKEPPGRAARRSPTRTWTSTGRRQWWQSARRGE